MGFFSRMLNKEPKKESGGSLAPPPKPVSEKSKTKSTAEQVLATTDSIQKIDDLIGVLREELKKINCDINATALEYKKAKEANKPKKDLIPFLSRIQNQLQPKKTKLEKAIASAEIQKSKIEDAKHLRLVGEIRVIANEGMRDILPEDIVERFQEEQDKFDRHQEKIDEMEGLLLQDANDMELMADNDFSELEAELEQQYNKPKQDNFDDLEKQLLGGESLVPDNDLTVEENNDDFAELEAALA